MQVCFKTIYNGFKTEKTETNLFVGKLKIKPVSMHLKKN